jgi:hypothetical protein
VLELGGGGIAAAVGGGGGGGVLKKEWGCGWELLSTEHVGGVSLGSCW